MLQLDNLLLAIASVVGVYVWHRTGLRTPNALGISARVRRRLLIVAGWALVVGVVIKSVGGQFGDGRVQIAKSGQMYAYRSRDPFLFWREIVGELLLVGGIGAVMIILGHRPTPGLDARDA
jgi:hypothetical protein